MLTTQTIPRLTSILTEWRARLVTLIEKLPVIKPLPPFPAQRTARIGLIMTFMVMAIYSVVMIAYLFTLHRALGTGGEDLGIMDQVLWNTAHGHFWHQTICNSVSDTNCLGDISRWAIHFEPLMILLTPLYWVIPGPNTLQVVQVMTVAAGALPAYWLAGRRFQNVAAGVGAAIAYLLLPAVRTAVVSDFHMVTIAAPLLMFALYFLYTRQNVGLFIFCVMALGTKEQVPLDVMMIALAVVFLQRRWRAGAALFGIAIVWMAFALWIIHISSPLGASPTAERYDGVMGSLQRLPLLITDPEHRSYIAFLLANSGGMGIFAPWTLLMALPSALLNALSASEHQYAGMYQYNADMGPFLWLGLVEGTIVAIRFVRRIAARWTLPPRRVLWAVTIYALLAACAVMLSQPRFRALNPNTNTNWPVPSVHAQSAQQLFADIPVSDSVSAQANLVPHLSERQAIYQFPSGINKVDYILLDVQGGYYPYSSLADYTSEVHEVLDSGTFDVRMTLDGYMLLERHPIAIVDTPVTLLPDNFCSFEDETDSDVVDACDTLLAPIITASTGGG